MDGTGQNAAAQEEGQAYRRALGAFATGVAVITVDGPIKPKAMTVNSFTSVSLTPRLVLWCLDDRSDRYALFANAPVWGVNVLAADQQGVSSRFARTGSSGLEAGDFERWTAEGPPVLTHGLTRLACRTYETRTWGDHLVIVGEVTAFSSQPGDGLTYFRGRYGQALTPDE
jgi:3-hydroxy-9,10-secoandrosta-1,3,5(10)-triene-9,17-dione monooxygenase reductase component